MHIWLITADYRLSRPTGNFSMPGAQFQNAEGFYQYSNPAGGVCVVIIIFEFSIDGWFNAMLHIYL